MATPIFCRSLQLSILPFRKSASVRCYHTVRVSRGAREAMNENLTGIVPHERPQNIQNFYESKT